MSYHSHANAILQRRASRNSTAHERAATETARAFRARHTPSLSEWSIVSASSRILLHSSNHIQVGNQRQRLASVRRWLTVKKISVIIHAAQSVNTLITYTVRFVHGGEMLVPNSVQQRSSHINKFTLNALHETTDSVLLRLIIQPIEHVIMRAIECDQFLAALTILFPIWNNNPLDFLRYLRREGPYVYRVHLVFMPLFALQGMQIDSTF